MVESVLSINNTEKFESVLKNSLPEGGDTMFVTKDCGMESGRGIVMVTFSVELPDGDIATAQTVISMRLFWAMARTILGLYNADGFRISIADPLDDEVIEEKQK